MIYRASQALKEAAQKADPGFGLKYPELLRIGIELVQMDIRNDVEEPAELKNLMTELWNYKEAILTEQKTLEQGDFEGEDSEQKRAKKKLNQGLKQKPKNQKQYLAIFFRTAGTSRKGCDKQNTERTGQKGCQSFGIVSGSRSVHLSKILAAKIYPIAVCIVRSGRGKHHRRLES